MDRRQRRHLARRAVARRRAGLHPFVLAAWLLAALACGAVLWLDAHFVIRGRGDASGLGFSVTVTFKCRGSDTEVVTDEPHPLYPKTERKTYEEDLAKLGDGHPEAEYVARLAGAGMALFVLACATPLLGLLALLWRSGSPTLRHVLLLLVALAPLAAMEYFGVAADELFAMVRARGALPDLEFSTAAATPATWWARIAWGGLALATAVSWWRSSKRREEAPVDPGVFE